MNPNIGMRVDYDQFQVKEILLPAVPPKHPTVHIKWF